MNPLDALKRFAASLHSDPGPTAEQVETLSRRGFVFGMTATAAGVLVAKKTLFLPARGYRIYHVMRYEGVSFQTNQPLLLLDGVPVHESLERGISPPFLKGDEFDEAMGKLTFSNLLDGRG